MNLNAVGIIHSRYKKLEDAPRQGGGFSEIEIYKEYQEGLKDIETFSHIHVIYWLHESRGFTLSVNTPWDPKPHGLFATRSSHRPSPIGYSVVRLLERKGNVLRVRGLDAIEGTKVIDIKPYIPEIDLKNGANSGWLKGRFKC
jgi:tRNA-Thr(GGU) m(6)t(6)A37 methyltransferase TsaA